MATAWPGYTRADYAPDKSLRTSRCVALASRQEVIAREAPFLLYSPVGAGTASATFITYASWVLQIPAAAQGKTLKAMFTASSGVGTTGEWRISVSGGNTGTVMTITANMAATLQGPSVVVLPSVASCTLNLELRRSAGAAGIFAYNTGDLVAWFED